MIHCGISSGTDTGWFGAIVADGLDPEGGVQGPRPFLCNSESSASSRSAGEVKIRRRMPHASNIASWWLWGNHTSHDHRSGWRVTTMILMSAGL